MIDPNLQAELRAKYNPDGSDLRKMQLRMLDMLKYIDKICRENDIKYWLSSGTCLGAVRHGGFIPWDDDVDIEMELDEYIKLSSLLKKTPSSQYVFQDYSTDNEYVFPYGKLRDLNTKIKENYYADNWNKYNGAFIDIFIMQPSHSIKIHKLASCAWWHSVIISAKIKNKFIRKSLHSISRKFCNRILFPFFKLIENWDNNNQIFRHTYGVSFHKPRYKSDFNETINLCFEDINLPVPSNYHHYLTSIFGDYMQLPNIISTHIIS